MPALEQQPSLRFFHLEVRGDEAIRSAAKVFDQILGAMLPSTAATPASDEPTSLAITGPTNGHAEQAKARRIVKRRKPVPNYEKPDDEPDGFRAPDPEPTQAKSVNRGGGAPSKKFNRIPGGKLPGLLGSEIISLLDRGSGVAPLEHLVRETGKSAQACNMSITKCERLKRMPDGRIALVGFRDED